MNFLHFVQVYFYSILVYSGERHFLNIIVISAGIRMHSGDFVEYPNHPRARGRGELPYVTNPALMRYPTAGKAKMKPSESTSSFEDLEDECAEMQTEAPRTM